MLKLERGSIDLSFPVSRLSAKRSSGGHRVRVSSLDPSVLDVRAGQSVGHEPMDGVEMTRQE